jgi:hypothetical protein
MTTFVVRYRTKPEHADENQRLVAAVFDELARTRPGGFRYTTLRLEDGVSFVHVAEVDSASGNPLTASPAFAAFTQDIAQRSWDPPLALEATVVGRYPPDG